jgi:hypothetical protein
VYSGFVLGLYVANEITRGAVEFRAEDALQKLQGILHDETAPTPSDVALIKSLPLSQDDHRFENQCHPILQRAAAAILEFRNGGPGEAESFVPA